MNGRIRQLLRPLGLLAMTHGCGAQNEVEAPGCVPLMSSMPSSWQPTEGIRFAPSGEPWTSQEQTAADRAVDGGLEEMRAFMAGQTERIIGLGEISVEAFIDTAYGASNRPQLAQKALGVAFENLNVIVQPYVGPEARAPTCDVVYEYLKLAAFAHSLSERMPEVEATKSLRADLVRGANQAVVDCGDLETMLGFDPKQSMANPNAANDDVWNWEMLSVNFTDSLANPDLRMPAGTAGFIADTWRYMSTYPVPLARDHKMGMADYSVYDGAYLMTHSAYMPTGYGRHRLKQADAPWLYGYIRENYYAALELGELDLFAEFVDLLRQYGCTEESDAQLRHGARYLMHLYEKAGRQWMAHREPYEGETISDYDAIHKPWTAISGLRRRVFEPLTAGSYGAAFRDAIGTEPHTSVYLRGLRNAH